MLPDKIKVFCTILSCIFIVNIIQANDEKIPKNKDPKKAFYFSLVPGMGQAYNGKILKSGTELQSVLQPLEAKLIRRIK